MSDQAEQGYLGSQDALNAQAGAGQLNQPSRTICAAVDRLDGLNARLTKIRDQVSHFADVVAGPANPVNAANANKSGQAAGIAGRLNDFTASADKTMTDIEVLLSEIAAALG